MAMSKSLRRRPEARAGYKAGYAWAESGRSLNDLEIAMDCATREFPDTPEGWVRKAPSMTKCATRSLTKAS